MPVRPRPNPVASAPGRSARPVIPTAPSPVRDAVLDRTGQRSTGQRSTGQGSTGQGSTARAGATGGRRTTARSTRARRRPRRTSAAPGRVGRRVAVGVVSVFGAGVVAAAIGIVVLVVIAVNSLHGLVGAGTTATAITCPAVPAKTVGGMVVPRGPVAGYCQDRLVNAAYVIEAAQSLGIGPHTQAVGVMTAMGESGLVDLDHGDAAGPDSRGLFQQRDNGAWGTYAQRMDPYTAATMFFRKLVSIPGWKTMTPTQAAHAVQVNADPDHYARYWPGAVQIVERLTGEDVPEVAPQ
ncbi:hypothetical protein [Curtobacterium sp. MCBD17_003]|uniref:hypothetical protein n=1 Tax=Curtobacterium sp. MCBD17_003 TaxID=2175667 RepID=UPI0011B7F94B|nr:hypothetical protein [Curtobacterium sp. MCBD17_003]WIE55725.1 hypothetical protein DEI88_005860 [Curtobacterium sp. MCBD17_003]